MDARTLEALKASIAKWERNAEVTSVDDAQIFSSTCPLCWLYGDGEGCHGCPVSVKTGEGDCGSTPWEDAWYYANRKQDVELLKAAARKEVAFLKSLLPEESSQ